MDRPAPAVRGVMAPGTALERLLVGSGLTFRRSSNGAYLISAVRSASPAPAEADQVITTVPEILVVARLTQNTDIARSPDDIQPYQVWNSRDVLRGMADTPDDVLRARMTTNAQTGQLPPNPKAYRGDVRSEISLRGLPSDETLVLIDGRRLPSLPAQGTEFQGNINGLPVGEGTVSRQVRAGAPSALALGHPEPRRALPARLSENHTRELVPGRNRPL